MAGVKAYSSHCERAIVLQGARRQCRLKPGLFFRIFFPELVCLGFRAVTEGCGYPRTRWVSYAKSTWGALDGSWQNVVPFLNIPRALPITGSVLLCHHRQRLNEVNDRVTFLLLQLILPRAKLGSISRGGLPVAVPALVHKHPLVFGVRKESWPWEFKC